MGLHDLAPEQIRIQVIWDQIHDRFPKFKTERGWDEDDINLESMIIRNEKGFIAALRDNWDYEEQISGGWQKTYIEALEALLIQIKLFVGESV